MSTRKYLFIVLLFTVQSLLSAQTPGYLGKRLSVQAELNSFIATKGPTASNKGENGWYLDNEAPGRFGLNWRTGLGVGYAISRRHQLYVNGDFLRTGVIQEAYAPYLDDYGTQQLADFQLFHEMSAVGGAIGLRTFGVEGGALSPMGFFHGWSLSAYKLKGNITRKALLNGEDAKIPLGIENASALSFALGYEIGAANIVIRDLALVTLGMRMNIPLRVRKLDLFDESQEVFTGDYLSDNQERFERAAITRMAYHSIFSIHLGVGLLAH